MRDFFYQFLVAFLVIICQRLDKTRPTQNKKVFNNKNNIAEKDRNFNPETVLKNVPPSPSKAKISNEIKAQPLEMIIHKRGGQKLALVDLV